MHREKNSRCEKISRCEKKLFLIDFPKFYEKVFFSGQKWFFRPLSCFFRSMGLFFSGFLGQMWRLAPLCRRHNICSPDRQSGASRVRRPRGTEWTRWACEPSERSGAGAPHTRGGRLSIWPEIKATVNYYYIYYIYIILLYAPLVATRSPTPDPTRRSIRTSHGVGFAS